MQIPHPCIVYAREFPQTNTLIAEEKHQQEETHQNWIQMHAAFLCRRLYIALYLLADPCPAFPQLNTGHLMFDIHSDSLRSFLGSTIIRQLPGNWQWDIFFVIHVFHTKVFHTKRKTFPIARFESELLRAAILFVSNSSHFVRVAFNLLKYLHFFQLNTHICK